MKILANKASHLTATNIKQIKIILKEILLGNLKLNTPYFIGKRKINSIYYVFESIEGDTVKGYFTQSTNEPDIFAKTERTTRKYRMEFKYTTK